MGNVLQHANEIAQYTIANLPLLVSDRVGTSLCRTCEKDEPRRESRWEWAWRQCPEKTRQ